jgi:prevent-host-death family protein
MGELKKDVVNVHEAKTHLSRLLERAHAGEEIILAKAGEPYAKLVPLEAGAERVPGQLRGHIVMTEAFFEPLPEDELKAWEGEK